MCKINITILYGFRMSSLTMINHNQYKCKSHSDKLRIICQFPLKWRNQPTWCLAQQRLGFPCCHQEMLSLATTLKAPNLYNLPQNSIWYFLSDYPEFFDPFFLFDYSERLIFTLFWYLVPKWTRKAEVFHRIPLGLHSGWCWDCEKLPN